MVRLDEPPYKIPCKHSPPSFHALRGMRLPDAPRRVDAERPGGYSYVERGNETGE